MQGGDQTTQYSIEDLDTNYGGIYDQLFDYKDDTISKLVKKANRLGDIGPLLLNRYLLYNFVYDNYDLIAGIAELENGRRDDFYYRFYRNLFKKENSLALGELLQFTLENLDLMNKTAREVFVTHIHRILRKMAEYNEFFQIIQRSNEMAK